MNDLIELHQHEIENLKQGIVDMEEKVQYQSEERLRDIYELLEVYQTRVSHCDRNKVSFKIVLIRLINYDNFCWNTDFSNGTSTTATIPAIG